MPAGIREWPPRAGPAACLHVRQPGALPVRRPGSGEVQHDGGDAGGIRIALCPADFEAENAPAHAVGSAEPEHRRGQGNVGSVYGARFTNATSTWVPVPAATITSTVRSWHTRSA